MPSASPMPSRQGTSDARDLIAPIGDILAAIGQPILVHRFHRPLYCNEAFARLFGYAGAAEVLALPDMQVLFPRAQVEANRRRQQAVLDGDAAACAPETCLRRRRDGTEIWVEIRRARVAWGGEPAVLSAVVDVSDRVAAEAMGIVLRDTLDGFSEAILITDPQDRVILANRSYHALHPDLPERDAIIGSDYGAVLRAMAERLAASMLPGTIDVGAWVEEQLLAHRGVTGIAKDTFSVGARHYQRQRERVANGGIVTVIIDVTARREFETALAERESVLRQAARIARWGHYIWDEDFKRMV
ncbi:MAG: PAS domain S-box protein, partial [Alphaproteobacteria bacterium]|nr:PAS domain S-box protein [Alphaproteobacteria bacterium]